jgi:hypothetical protein
MTGWPALPRAQHGDRVWLESTIIALGMTTIRSWFSRSLPILPAGSG